VGFFFVAFDVFSCIFALDSLFLLHLCSSFFVFVFFLVVGCV